ncbi:MAG: permease-like cell division protein FtsX [Desulfuromonadales bacterium]|nr:permease-like cell division protein FtsX [Desulfuromonadales bacterium]
MLEAVRYFFLRALRNMRQWPFLCSAAILTMAVSLATIATFFLIVVNIEQLASRWTQEIQVIAYLQRAPSAQELPTLINKMEQLEGVEKVAYVSPQAAMERFRERLGEDAALLQGVRPDLLPASFELGLVAEYRSQKGIEVIIEQLESLIAIDDLRYGQTWLERFNNFVSMLRFVGAFVGGFLLFATLFIVANTIRLTLYARRDELEIMALVGATMRFIKIPFMLEGAIQGFVGGLLSLLFLSASFSLIISKSLNAFWLTPADFDLLFLTAAQQLFLVLAGVVLGVLGSLSSLRRFVRI